MPSSPSTPLAAPGSGLAELPLLDDSVGCRGAGSLGQLALLRRLLRAELLRETAMLRDASSADGASMILHRWTSACGFCGALRLRDRVERWRRGLRSGTPDPRPGDFDRVVAATCAAIERACRRR